MPNLLEWRMQELRDQVLQREQQRDEFRQAGGTTLKMLRRSEVQLGEERERVALLTLAEVGPCYM
jgi:hypothetical protein